jgi:predicted Zn-ribbon and HTH transcriptional regulator
MAFARVKTRDLEKASFLATSRGLEHYVHSFGEGFDDWTTLQFTNVRGKLAFEALCQENGIIVDGQQIVQRMLDKVIEGEEAEEVIEGLTAGMVNALNRSGAKLTCKECGLPIPKYTGRYPGKCPECGGELTVNSNKG